MLKLEHLKVKSFVTRQQAQNLAGGALAAAEFGLVKDEIQKTNQSLMDCPTEPVLCPP
ncbi:MAG: pinensin family lanthipeptide [Acidobacteriota bacterium]|nr:pinensin family lanthipeptide [Acidobacteriota bacterium]